MRAGLSNVLGRTAFAAALGLAVGGFAPGTVPARAADLGGDCCADLEARVAELEATTARKGNRKVSLTLSGRVNMNVMWWGDNSAGTDSHFTQDRKSGVYVGNTANNESRFSFNGVGRISSDLSAGFNLSWKVDPEGALIQDAQVTRAGNSVLYTDTTYVFAKSEKWGEYRLGYLPSASDDAYYVDFGAPGTVGGLYGSRFVGSFRLRATNLKGELTDVTYTHVLGEMPDTNDMRLVYISPTWHGFAYKSDMGHNTGSAELSWVGAVGSLQGAWAAGYEVTHGLDAQIIDGLPPGVTPGQPSVQSPSTAAVPFTDVNHDTQRQLALSGSILENKTGLFLTGEYSAAYANVPGRQDGTNWFVRTGWTKNVTGWGATTIDAQYERTDNKLANNTSAHLWGIGIDQAIYSVASNIYLHYQHDSFDTSGVVMTASSASAANACAAACSIDAQSIDSVTAGMVVNF